MTARSVVVYADYNCPWSYLASRRADILAADGLEVDWRAVEHDPCLAGRHRIADARFEALRADLGVVSGLLLPGEGLPHALAGFASYTRAAVSGYAEAFGVAAGPTARRVLFEAFWMHGLDLADPKVVRTLLTDAVRSSASGGPVRSEPWGTSPGDEALREWGYAVDVTGGPITTRAWRLIRQWGREWHDLPKLMVPVLSVDGGEPVFGEAALEWLGEELLARGLDPEPQPPGVGSVAVGSAATEPAMLTERVAGPGPVPVSDPGERARRSRHDARDLSWVTQHGNRWMRAYREAHTCPDVFDRVG